MARVLLTDKFCAGVKQPGEYHDAKVPGLSFRVLPSGEKTLSFRYRSPRDGSRPRIDLGTYPATSLAAARAKALTARAQLDDGIDPSLDAGTGEMTVSHLIASYIALHVRPNLRSHAELERRLRKDIEPIIGNIRLGELHRRDCTRAIDLVLARQAPVAANRAFEDLRAMLRWATRRGTLERNPCEGMRRPTEERPRTRVLTDDEIRHLWAALPEVMPQSPARILRLCLITAQRLGEVAGMERDELDLTAATWTIPGRRTKNGETHVVPLSSLALELISEALADIPATERYLFRWSTIAVDRTLARARAPTKARPNGRLGMAHWAPHDLRRTALTGMAKIGIAPVTIGAVANHLSTTKAGVTLGIYVQHRYTSEMRHALDLWADCLRGILAGDAAAKIIPLRQGGG